MIKINTKERSYALGVQKKIGLFDFPFTLNPYIGCEMQCAYCFVPGPVIKKTRNDFFTTVEIKDKLLDTLKKELKQYKTLPQHLKRVQVGVTTELFQPKVISNMRIGGNDDLVEKILATFKNEWDNGNKWMLHILTKNHNIINYLPILKNMKEMIQVEFSFIHHDEAVSRKYEKYTSSISKRLDAIKQISNEGIFVRVMAMPFYGDQCDLNKLKGITFAAGSKAFKNKELNYYDWSQFQGINAIDPINRTKIKSNSHIPSLIIKSGEEKTPKIMVEVEMPKIRKRNEKFINWAKKPNEGLEKQSLPQIEMGYSSINNVDWGYLK
ncbi:MAG: radical SAM protein [Melioribacteraceae bacterium]